MKFLWKNKTCLQSPEDQCNFKIFILFTSRTACCALIFVWWHSAHHLSCWYLLLCSGQCQVKHVLTDMLSNWTTAADSLNYNCRCCISWFTQLFLLAKTCQNSVLEPFSPEVFALHLNQFYNFYAFSSFKWLLYQHAVIHISRKFQTTTSYKNSGIEIKHMKQLNEFRQLFSRKEALELFIFLNLSIYLAPNILLVTVITKTWHFFRYEHLSHGSIHHNLKNKANNKISDK